MLNLKDNFIIRAARSLMSSGSTVKITCLGGTGEIGMNLYIYENAQHAVVVDYGVMFADMSMPGVDSILPDPDYLKSIKDKVSALVFTHGHEDHIGGVLEAVSFLDVPVYTGRFTAELISHKAERAGIKLNINVVSDSDTIETGGFKIRFITVPHSIPDTFALHIACKSFTAIHASDFRTDGDVNKVAGRFTKWGKPVCLLLDSTNADSRKENHREEEVFSELTEIFANAEGRIFFTTFASNVQRLGAAIEAAKLAGRKIVLEGAAVERTVGIASRLGLVNLPEDMVVTTKQAYREEPGKLVYLVSGCQGEFTSALYSIAMGERKAVHMVEKDLLIFSSRSIPGNEGGINAMINTAMRRGVEVIQANDRNVHVSGHVTPSEVVRLVSEVRPKYFVPVHGEYRHLHKNARLAEKAGVNGAECVMLESGRQIIFENGQFKNIVEVPSGRIYVDYSGGFILDAQALSERRQIARDGVVVVLMGREIKLKTYGFCLDGEQRRRIMAALENRADYYAGEDLPDAELARKAVKRFFRKNFGRRPLIDIIEENFR